MKVQANGLAIEVEDSGEVERPAVLLAMGLGMQLVAWPEAFLAALHGAGLRVIRFDNRDIGLSTQLDHLGTPNLLWESLKLQFGLPLRPPYRLHDMAADALGVLDALGVRQAHVVGLSMGGMIAQRVALAAPQRVLSLTSIMSSSGARALPGPTARATRALLARPRGRGEEAIVDHFVHLFQVIGSPAFPSDEAELRARIRLALRRSHNPAGSARQLAAVAADSGRAEELSGIRAPTLVIHGTADPLVPIACGHDTARRIPGARFVAVRGMGHDLPPAVVERVLQALLPHLR
jgi:pimeloyl-ACP methyl ester carboxylesterase